MARLLQVSGAGGIKAVLLKDIPSIGVLVIVVENAVEHITPQLHGVQLASDLVIVKAIAYDL